MLFFFNFKKEFNLLRSLKHNKLAQSAIEKVNILKEIYKNIIKI